MEKTGKLTAKSFLKQPENRLSYECSICYEVCIKPVRCKGSCEQIFCMKCVSDTRNNSSDKCPSRCSSPFLVTLLPEIEVQFYCPYNPSLCIATITSLKQFQLHHLSCQFVPIQEVRLRKLQSEYRCLKGHFLQFYVGSYQEMIKTSCIECQQQKLCRSYCRICSQFYCICCRAPPCSKEGCPIGHSFNFQRIATINYICDICGISTAVSNGGVYDCSSCNYGICEDCYSSLPDRYDESKPRSIVKNINTQCSCGKKLVLINEIHQVSECDLCKKEKQCPKYCTNCDKKYCIDCKLMDIYSDMTCSRDHQWQKITRNDNPQFLLLESKFGCMRCRCSKQVYLFDQKCYSRLCQDCFIYCMKVTTDKERPIELTCNHNHILKFDNGEEDYYDICSQCKKNKFIKLGCIFCSENQNFFCFECKPIPLNTCYYKHNLKQARFRSPKECQYCQVMTKRMSYCKKCSFYVCSECVIKSLEGLMLEQEDSRLE